MVALTLPIAGNAKIVANRSVSQIAPGRAQQLAFKHIVRGTPIGSHIVEPRLARSQVVAHAAGRRDSDDGERERFQERVVQVRRVTKVVKGGKQLSFRAVVSG